MEFGLFVQGYVPAARAKVDPEAEHKALIEETEYVIQADKSGFKYAWASEHHFLEEYSHISANDVYLGYLAHATDRIHLGSGIFNPLAPVNHPVKVAEKVAMLDHLSEGRFEFGSGRGAGSHEILGFMPGITDMNHTKELWEETIAEFPKMWLQDEYVGFQGKHWSLPPRKILPKPYGKSHPAMWYAAGSPSSYAMAGRKGLGVLGFSVQKVSDMEWVVESYKTAVKDAEPVGDFVNDNVMVTSTAICAETHAKAVEIAVGGGLNYLQSLLFRYHDTFPRPDGIPEWPELLPEYTEEIIELLIAEELMICGDPDEVLAQCKRWEQAGADQLSFGLPIGVSRQDTLNSIKLIGEHVIPKIDTDPVHRTSRFRDAA
ncbi:LLM class flavin-dependent oxidoreductase [Streptomyces sp. NBC_00053]|uniref:LLM class flavin-dependent oxidoreductase n=1 Tax=Streptomyces TaxID=1883 RepID=UPI000F5B9649|nr:MULTISPECIES: LLM class flavin-dependent oxidoreductase [Streptomyces]WSG51449.1 LLM class flavin-dependent oxidoreductase [Streptomyces sp. NBC_01732]WSX02106.1 LLM class flavin-dependent oxidoreductase [Streptomyces sp. NBC_00987]MCT2544282.1 LLM class flavin-dependent oxidoreductase [Streptomyces atratus]MCX5101378.1 LLM class flavin-dependent oxidoreductase [Streptomyces sp. NBC_00439]MCX5160900.1 LLM class flavin-dependent oxidoreductase [Streptomyces sp. NBC_00305]